MNLLLPFIFIALHVALTVYTLTNWKKLYTDGRFRESVKKKADFFRIVSIILILLLPTYLIWLLTDNINTWISRAKAAGWLTVLTSVLAFSLKAALKWRMVDLISAEEYKWQRVVMMFLIASTIVLLATTLLSIYHYFILSNH